MQMVIIALVIAVIVLFGICKYRTRIIEDYETRLPRIYQSIVDECNELKAYLELEERASREPYMRGKLNEMICKYSRYYRKEQNKTFTDAIKEACEEVIKKN